MPAHNPNGRQFAMVTSNSALRLSEQSPIDALAWDAVRGGAEIRDQLRGEGMTTVGQLERADDWTLLRHGLDVPRRGIVDAVLTHSGRIHDAVGYPAVAMSPSAMLSVLPWRMFGRNALYLADYLRDRGVASVGALETLDCGDLIDIFGLGVDECAIVDAVLARVGSRLP